LSPAEIFKEFLIDSISKSTTPKVPRKPENRRKYQVVSSVKNRKRLAKKY
jgi:hypothetical protein